MENSAAVQSKPKTPSADAAWRPRLQDDPHWELAQRVVAGPHFARSHLMSKFLLFVVAETLEGRGSEISEHQIGVQVFDRPVDYRTLEDNIVRNYARQLRKRLADHFAEQGLAEPVRIDIPVGGYVPVFVPASRDNANENVVGMPAQSQVPGQPLAAQTQISEPVSPRRAKTSHWILGVVLTVAYSAALICATWYFARRPSPASLLQEPAHALWAALFSGPANSYIVPSDAGFNLLEDISRRPVPLADYIAGKYQEMTIAGV